MSDFYHQAEFLIKRGYVSGMTISQLADKLEKSVDKPVPEGAHTRESVFDEAGAAYVEKRLSEAPESKKRLITPGERTSAAIQTWHGGPPLSQDDV